MLLLRLERGRFLSSSQKAPTFEEIQKKAQKEDAKAQYELGVMYSQGEVVKNDDLEAFKWYKKSAEQGFAEAQYIV